MNSVMMLPFCRILSCRRPRSTCHEPYSILRFLARTVPKRLFEEDRFFQVLRGINTRRIYQEGTTMQVIESRVEAAGSGRIRVITTIDIAEHGESEIDELGAGPTGDAIPDRIVHALIANHGASM